MKYQEILGDWILSCLSPAWNQIHQNDFFFFNFYTSLPFPIFIFIFIFFHFHWGWTKKRQYIRVVGNVMISDTLPRGITRLAIDVGDGRFVRGFRGVCNWKVKEQQPNQVLLTSFFASFHRDPQSLFLPQHALLFLFATCRMTSHIPNTTLILCTATKPGFCFGLASF